MKYSSINQLHPHFGKEKIPELCASKNGKKDIVPVS
jgi:hypothetical protein